MSSNDAVSFQVLALLIRAPNGKQLRPDEWQARVARVRSSGGFSVVVRKAQVENLWEIPWNGRGSLEETMDSFRDFHGKSGVSSRFSDTNPLRNHWEN